MKTKTKLLLSVPLLLLLLVGGAFFAYKLIHEAQNVRHSNSPRNLARFLTDCRRCWSIDRTGLQEANFSGSGALMFKQLKSLRENLSNDLLVVNGLGYKVWYLNDRHLRHLCYQYDGKEFKALNRKKKFMCAIRRYLAGVPSTPEDVDLKDLYTESQQLDRMGIKHISPLPLSWAEDWSYIDDLVQVFEGINPKETHLHFHCEHGKGRTTTMMLLYDIFRNGRQVDLQSIVDRNYCLGGEDIMNTAPWKKGTWTVEGLVNRRNLVIAFFHYINDPKGYKSTSWSEWLERKKREKYAYLPVHIPQGKVHRKDA